MYLRCLFFLYSIFLSVLVNAQEYTEKSAGANIVMTPITGGSFIMGSSFSERGRMTDEHQHTVKVLDFYLGTFEVTQAQYQAVTGVNPSVFTLCGGDCPVTNVSWIDAVKFCNALSEKAGLPLYYTIDGNKATTNATNGYRLPTEAEWEYAARAHTTTMLYTGEMNEISENNCVELDKIAVYSGNSCVQNEADTSAVDCSALADKQVACTRCAVHKIGSKQPNTFGLYDMIGNVWEWCYDFYGCYFPELEGKDETMETVKKTKINEEVSNPQGAATGRVRVRRGGAWNSGVKNCRVAKRSNRGAASKENSTGFRVCRNR